MFKVKQSSALRLQNERKCANDNPNAANAIVKKAVKALINISKNQKVNFYSEPVSFCYQEVS